MEHLTKNTEYDEYQTWCVRCQKFTRHRRRPGERTGHCTEVHPPTAAQLANERRAKAIAMRNAHPNLFEGDQ